MRILFIARSTLFNNPGGDTIQILNTCGSLRKLGIEVDIKLSKDEIDYKLYDLVHYFNIIRPADILYHIRKGKRPYVVSTVFVDYSEFDKTSRLGFTGFIFKLLPKNIIEYLKVIGRAILSGERIVSFDYLILGQKRSIKKIIKNARILLPNSQNEYDRLEREFHIQKEYKVIPNAIDTDIFIPEENVQRDNNLVLCVGRIEGLKNQLNLIRALNNSKYQLIIIGKKSTNQINYFNQCIKEASDNVQFIDGLPQADLVAYYNKAKVHVLPSWFETTGLSSLEAGAMGCNVVITDKGDTKEYFGDMAYYCDPNNINSIKNAVERASESPQNKSLQYKIRSNYTWSIAALKTLEAYQLSLNIQKL